MSSVHRGSNWGSGRIYAVRRFPVCDINCRGVIWKQAEMITRSNLAEQLRDYQVRSQHKWAPLTLFSSTTQITSGSDAAKAGLWALLFLALLIFSFIALYLRYTWLGFTFVCLAILLPISRFTLTTVCLFDYIFFELFQELLPVLEHGKVFFASSFQEFLPVFGWDEDFNPSRPRQRHFP